MKLHINGDSFEMDRRVTITKMVEGLDIESQRMAIEVNGHVIKRSLWSTYTLSEHDKIEILEFVGGG